MRFCRDRLSAASASYRCEENLRLLRNLTGATSLCTRYATGERSTRHALEGKIGIVNRAFARGFRARTSHATYRSTSERYARFTRGCFPSRRTSFLAHLAMHRTQSAADTHTTRITERARELRPRLGGKVPVTLSRAHKRYCPAVRFTHSAAVATVAAIEGVQVALHLYLSRIREMKNS